MKPTELPTKAQLEEKHARYAYARDGKPIHFYERDVLELLDHIDAQQALIDRLVSALRPFVHRFVTLPADWNVYREVSVPITVGNIRKAQALIEEVTRG